MNNPLIYWDPDGEKVEFAQGVSDEFKKDFAKTVQFMNEKGTSVFLAKLQSSDKTYYINSTNKNVNSFNPKTSTINWNSRLGKVTTNYESLSPTTLLNHEADHALQYDTNPEQFKKEAYKSNGGADSQYGTKEERRVITGSEQITAVKHGDIQPGSVTRNDHSAAGFFPVDDPTSNDGVTAVANKVDSPTKTKKRRRKR